MATWYRPQRSAGIQPRNDKINLLGQSRGQACSVAALHQARPSLNSRTYRRPAGGSA